jgi:hypothetical protein
MTFSARLRLATALAAGTLLQACGDDSPATPTPSPTPTPAPPALVLSYQPVWELDSQYYIVEEFAIPAEGVITATVDWQSSDNNVDVVVTKAPCSAQEFFRGDRQCRIYGRDEALARKPAVATFTADASMVGGARIWVLNKGPRSERGSFLIEHQPPQ